MKKVFTAIVLLLFIFQCACVQNISCVKKEQPHLYWKDINVVVEQVDRRHWFASGHHYVVKVTVRSDEYNLDYTDVFSGGGLFTPKQWSYSEGDIVKAKLYSWMIDSTGEVIRRKIHRVY